MTCSSFNVKRCDIAFHRAEGSDDTRRAEQRRKRAWINFVRDSSEYSKEQSSMKAEATMRDVVDQLRAQNSAALLELAEFDHALDELLKNVELIAPTLQDLQHITTKVVELGTTQPLAWVAVRDHTIHLNTWIGQFLNAFRQLRGAVQGWNIAGTPNESKLPTSGERPIPPG